MQHHATLMVVVDEPLFVDGLKLLLARFAPAIQCIAVPAPAHALEQLQAKATPHLLIADHQLPEGVNGLVWLQHAAVLRPGMRCALMSSAIDPVLALQAQRIGLAGYLSKTMEPQQLLQALNAMLAEQCCFVEPASMTERRPASTSLNERQISVLQLASVGLGNRQIAARLHLTERTVKYHLRETFLRLSSSCRTEAVAKAAALGLISLDRQHPPGV
jgi:DNA-binding NarL/FixJ family response regulator